MNAGGVNFTSFLFMNVYSIYTLLFWFMPKRKKNIIYVFSVCIPLLMNWQKGGEKFRIFIYACLFNLLSFTIGIKNIFCWYIKSMFISLVSNIMFMHIYVEHSRYIFIVYCYAWVKGASMKLNFNPCIYNSMSFVIIKRGEIVSPEALHSSFDDD